MRTTTKSFKDLISLCLCICISILCFASNTNNNPTKNNSVKSEFAEDPAGNVSISMVTVGSFPDYGTNIPFNITVENQGANDVYDIVVTNTIPVGYTFDATGTNWIPTASPNVYTNTIPGPIGNGGSELITINLVPIASADSTDWINVAEITEFRDAPGGTICADSDVTDNIDMTAVQLFDLALRKELFTTGDLCFGQSLIFRTYVMNQGNTPATDIEVIDFIPEGYTFDPNTAINMANGWTNNVNPTAVLPGQLNSNEETYIEIELTLEMEMFDEMAWNNYTTINAANDDTGAERGSFDADSEVGTNSAIENMVLPGSADDNNMNGGGPNAGEDEDDHDPAAPMLFDLALEKLQVTALPSFSYNEEVVFRNNIYNQGNQTVTNIEVVDYIPCGLEFNSADNPGWTYNTLTRIAHYQMTSVLAPAEDDFVELTLTVVQCYEGQDSAWTNFAEIASATDMSGMPFNDVDSVMDSIMSNDGTPIPNQLDGGGPKANEDEDDHDIKMIEVVDLALRKRILEPGPFNFGDTITFVNTVYNQGNIVLDSIQIRDYLPDGYSFPADINPTWTANAFGNPEGLIPDMIFPEDTINYELKLILIPADDETDYYNYSEIVFVQDTTNSFFKNRFDDADSFVGSHLFFGSTEPNVLPDSPDDDQIFEDGFAGGDSDDNDVAAPIFYDLALSKNLADPNAMIDYGMPIEYVITVTNEGTMVANNITVTDYLPCGLTIDMASNPGWSLDAATGYVTFEITNPITPGASVDLTLNLSVQECDNTDAGSFTNVAEISIDDGDDRDSTPDDTPGDDPDEDDIDSQPIKVFDLSLTKEIAGGTTSFSIGDPITFTIEILNEGGDTVQNVKVVDYLTCGYAFDAGNNTGWSLNAMTGFLEYSNIGMLPPGESFSTDLNLTLQSCATADVDNYVNGAEISSAEDTDVMIIDDIDSTPDEVQGNDDPDEDDYDEVRVDIFDLSLDKAVTTEVTDLSYGDIVDYDITVTNEGTVMASGIEVTDYIPCGFEYDNANNSIPWIIDINTGYASYTIPNDIAPGASETVTISLTLQPCANSNTDKFNNKAEISVDNDDDDDSTPDDNPDNDPPSEDDNDDEPIAIYDLSLTKEVSVSQSYSIGDDITFFITVTNEGGESVQNIKIVDYLPCGYSFAPHFGWTTNAAGLIENTYANVLDPGESVTLSLQLTIVPCTDAQPDNYLNGAEISEMQDLNDMVVTDVDSTPDDIQGNDDSDEDDYGEARIDIYDLSLEKSLTNVVTDFSYGEVISYDITVTNEGTLVASGVEITDYIPCGLAYDANNNALAWTVDATTGYASYTIPNDIAPGDSETVTIALTLESCTENDPDKYNNVAEISDDNGDDDDSTPDNNPDNDPDDEDDNDNESLPIYDLSLMKEVAVATNYSVGDMITFDITVTNEGSESVQNIKVVDYLPCGYSFVDNNGWTLNATSGLIENMFTGPLAIGESFTLSLELTIVNCMQGGADNYLNGAEISQMEDLNGDPATDSDSTPDETQGNEDPNEDDYDEAKIDIYDLSLSKVRTSANDPLMYGSSISYDVTVTNEGSLPATNVEITDYIPCGFLYDSSNNALGWSLDATGNAVNTLSQTILPGESETVSITLVIEPCNIPTIDSYNNRAEISDDDGDDDDSTPDNNPDNDPDDEDDKDDEPIDVYDLAIDKTVIQDPNDLTIGDIISFEMVVTNEGNRTVQDINVIDYVPCGLSVAGQANPGWSAISGSDNITYNITQLEPGESATISVSFLIVNCDTPGVDDYNNETEITDFDDENGNEGEDIDSTPDDIPGDPEEEDDNDLVEIELAGNLGGDVWKDLDFDGIHDTNEPAIVGMTVNLFDCDGNFIRSTTTGQTGFYVFPRLPADDYQVQFDLGSIDEPCIFTESNVGGNDEIDSDAEDNGFAPCTTVEPGMDNYTIDAGLIENLGSIGDFVFMDLDADGIQDFGENGIPGVTVYLYTEGGLAIDSTVTDAQGAYIFEDVSTGSYYIGFGVMDDYLPTLADNGSDAIDSDVSESNGPNTTDVFVLAPGETNSDVDGGFYQCATICGYTWLDMVIENDLRDFAENGINGMKVTVFKVENGIATAYDQMNTGINPDTPSDDGYFNFCVPPGRYYLEFTLPPLGLVQVLPLSGPQDINSDVTNANGIGTTSAFTMTNGGEKCDIGAGYTLMSQVGNAVWFDENHNGLRESTEAPVEGVMVQAYDLNNVMVAETVTDENGLYNIDYLQKKDYYLKFTPDNGMAFTQALAGEDDVDSDVDHSYGPNTTRLFLGEPGSQNKNMDAGLVLGVLPVEWGTVNAVNKGDYNLISWSTLTEINNETFWIQRASEAGGNYITIGEIQVEQPNSTLLKSYSFEDRDLIWNQYYYQIVQVDVDGRQSNSDVVVVNISKNEFLLYPNPAERELRISNDSFEDMDLITIKIYDTTGKLAHEENLSLNGLSEIQIPVRQLPSGMYTVDLIDNGTSLFTQRFIKK